MKKILILHIVVEFFLIFGCASTKISSALFENENSTSIFKNSAELKKVTAQKNGIPTGTTELLESFEEENFWYTASDFDRNDFSFFASISDEWSTDGERCGIWSFGNIPTGKVASFCLETFSLRDFSDAKFLIANIRNETQSPFFIYAQIESENSKLITREANIGIGENSNVIFDLTNLFDYDGNSHHCIDEIKKVSRLSFKISGKKSCGEISIDEIRLVR